MARGRARRPRSRPTPMRPSGTGTCPVRRAAGRRCSFATRFAVIHRVDPRERSESDVVERGPLRRVRAEFDQISGWHVCDKSPDPRPMSVRSCRCTTSCSAIATPWSSRGRRPAHRATGGRCSHSCPTSSTHASVGSACTGARSAGSIRVLRELGQTRAGWLTSEPVRVLAALQALPRPRGCPRRRSTRSRTGRSPTASRAPERALLAYTDCLVDRARPCARCRVRRAARALQRRGDPRVHLHHRRCTSCTP